MPKMTNKNVIKAYFQDPSNNTIESHAGNLYISNNRLMNYSTCLVEKHVDYGFIVNRTSYSVTTSKIQGYIMSELWNRFSGEWITENVIQVENVPMSTSSLVQAAQKLIEWSKGIKPVKLINYFDVWGNKKDGWEINNMCEEHKGKLELHEDSTNEEIVKYLKNIGFLKSTARMNQIMFHDLDNMGVEIYQKKDQQPICRIEFVGGRY